MQGRLPHGKRLRARLVFPSDATRDDARHGFELIEVFDLGDRHGDNEDAHRSERGRPLVIEPALLLAVVVRAVAFDVDACLGEVQVAFD